MQHIDHNFGVLKEERENKDFTNDLDKGSMNRTDRGQSTQINNYNNNLALIDLNYGNANKNYNNNNNNYEYGNSYYNHSLNCILNTNLQYNQTKNKIEIGLDNF